MGAIHTLNDIKTKAVQYEQPLLHKSQKVYNKSSFDIYLLDSFVYFARFLTKIEITAHTPSAKG